MTRGLARLVCRLFDHRWETRALDADRASLLCHLSSLAGTLSVCRRCGEVFDDIHDSRLRERLGLPPEAAPWWPARSNPVASRGHPAEDAPVSPAAEAFASAKKSDS